MNCLLWQEIKIFIEFRSNVDTPELEMACFETITEQRLEEMCLAAALFA